MIDAELAGAGRRVGRYASPHVVHINGGRPIGDASLAAALSTALDRGDSACRDGSPAMHSTWFDVMTAAAFLSIAAEKAGIIKAGCSLITPISLRSSAGLVIEAVAASKSAPISSVVVQSGATISQQNLAVAHAALPALGGRGIRSIVRNGLLGAADLSEEVAGSVKLPGRMERFRVPADLRNGRWLDVVLVSSVPEELAAMS